MKCSECGKEALNFEDYAVCDSVYDSNKGGIQSSMFIGFVRFQLCELCIEKHYDNETLSVGLIGFAVIFFEFAVICLLAAIGRFSLILPSLLVAIIVFVAGAITNYFLGKSKRKRFSEDKSNGFKNVVLSKIIKDYHDIKHIVLFNYSPINKKIEDYIASGELEEYLRKDISRAELPRRMTGITDREYLSMNNYTYTASLVNGLKESTRPIYERIRTHDAMVQD